MKKLFALAFLLILFVSSKHSYALETATEQAHEQIQPLIVDAGLPGIQVYGVELDAPSPFVRDGIVWAPFRAVAEAFHCRVDWNDDTQTVSYILQNGRYYTFAVDGKNAVIIGDRTFVPYDFLLEQHFEKVNIDYMLGYSKISIHHVIKNRAAFKKAFIKPNEIWNLREVLRGLPYPDGFRYYGSGRGEQINLISIEYRYDEINAREGGNGLNPFHNAVAENNALILFATFEDLEQVNFEYYFSDESDHVESYTLDDIIECFGEINPIEMKFTELYNALIKNIRPSEFYFTHYSRIYLGADFDDVQYRNAEPDEILRQPDGSVIWIYKELSKSWDILPSGGQAVADPGHMEIYYFNNPSAMQNDGLDGLYATKKYISNGESYFDLVAYLGCPAAIKDMGNNYKYIAYPLKEGQQRTAYYILNRDKIVAEGVMYGDDYKILDY